jgi:hypothetical protein
LHSGKETWKSLSCPKLSSNTNSLLKNEIIIRGKYCFAVYYLP